MLVVGLSLLLAYLLGSFPSAYIVGRTTRGIDIRQHGSGNMGAMNTREMLGWPEATVVFLLDVFKGVLAVYLGHWSGTDPLLLACLAVTGHCYPVWLRFQGGKGLATALGALLIVRQFWPILVFGVGWSLVFIYYRWVGFLTRQGINMHQGNSPGVTSGRIRLLPSLPPSQFSDQANIAGTSTLMLYALFIGPDWWLLLLAVIIMLRLAQSLSNMAR